MSDADSEKARDLRKQITAQNWKNGGALVMDTDEADALLAAAFAEERERVKTWVWEELHRHTFLAKAPEVGDTENCLLCRKNFRDEIHLRSGEPLWFGDRIKARDK